MPMDHRLMNIRKLASCPNVNERMLTSLVWGGIMPLFKAGNQWRFRKTIINICLDDPILRSVRNAAQSGDIHDYQ